MPSRLPHSLVLAAALSFAMPTRARAQETTSRPSAEELAYTSCAKVPPDKLVRLGKYGLKTTMTFGELLAVAARLTCKRFVVRPDLRLPSMHVFVSVPMSPRQIFRLVVATLFYGGASVIKSGPLLKISQVNNLVMQDTEYYGIDSRAFPRDDRVITKVLRPVYADARALLPILNKMKHHRAALSYHLPSNTIILAGGANNIRRLVKIVDELDVPLAQDGVWMVTLKHLDAEDLHKVMLQLFFQNPLTRIPKLARERSAKLLGLPSASKILVEPVLNSLIFIARGADFAGIRKLIDELDQPTKGDARRRLHVVKLQHADAEALAQVLSSVVGTSSAASRSRSRGRSVQRRLRRYLAAGAKSKKGPLFSKQVQISADKSTSSLLVASTLADFLRLRPLIKKLDIPRRQVFVEMAILELSVNHEQRLGIAYHGGGIAGSGDSQAIIFGGVQHSGLGSLLLDLSSLQGLSAGVRGALVDGSAELLGLQADIPGLGIMLQALGTDSNVNVLSAPHLLTTDNEQAEITVGQNLPFQGALGRLGGGVAGLALPTVNVQRQDVALKVKLTPHIGARGMVRIQLEAEIQDITSPNFNGLGPATSKRSTKTTLVLGDQQSAIVGGLQGSRLNETVSKVPLLGDIPILGYLFKHRSKSRQRTSIVIVLTPYVIRDAYDLRRIFKRKLAERDRFIRRYTAMRARKIGTDINYRHKHGLLSEMHAVAREVERDEARLAAAQATLGATPPPRGPPRKAPPIPPKSDGQ
ncbi:MAG: type II secretion system secretin GspD [Myxococcales bacterium]|nr:type II secretion system secretin GspD [Myxococcales bacterium]